MKLISRLKEFLTRLRKLFAGVLGNIASDVWFIPKATNYLHLLRGVRFKDVSSVFFGRGVTIDNRLPQKVFIGRDVVFAPRSSVIAHSYIPQGNRVIGTNEVIKDVEIGDSCFIGMGAIILPGVHLSHGCYVAAGSVVLEGRYPINSLIAGNPGSVKRTLI